MANVLITGNRKKGNARALFKHSKVNTMTKKIKITSNGILRTKGGVRGPVLRPYVETLANIRNLVLIDRATVVEVLKDGSEITLDQLNYAKDNSGEETTKVETPQNDNKTEENTTPVQEHVQESKPVYDKYSNKKNKHKNKFQQNNNSQKSEDVNPQTEETNSTDSEETAK